MTGAVTFMQYRRAAAIRFIIYLIASSLFPFLGYAVVKATNCAMDTCGAAALIVGMYGKTLIYLVFVASFVRITMRRIRDLQLPVELSFILPLLMLGDAASGIAANASWSVRFALGGGYMSFFPLITTWIIFLSITPSGSPSQFSRSKINYVMLALLLGMMVLAIFGFVSTLYAMFGGVLLMPIPLMRFVGLLSQIALVFSLYYCFIRHSGQSSQNHTM